MIRRMIGRHILSAIIASAAMIGPATAANIYVNVSDASQLSFQLTSDGRVYLRNINYFDSNALPCCYNYWIDTTTQEGKNTYALILSYSAMGRGFRFDIGDYTTPQQITWVGPW
jgi:hypothetical protein